jgi:tetratricopeptide (TPR) repeat protein
MKRKLGVIVLVLMSFTAPAFSAGSSEPTTPSNENYPEIAPKVTPPAATAPAAGQSTAPIKPDAVTVQSELARVKVLLGAKNYRMARAELRKIDKVFRDNADVNNLLGYSSRKLKMYSASATYYTKALKINPSHLGALEYQGELFVTKKKIAAAKRNLQKIEELCGVDCIEYKDLKAAIGGKK